MIGFYHATLVDEMKCGQAYARAQICNASFITVSDVDKRTKRHWPKTMLKESRLQCW